MRILLFSGKGGVGKTSLAAATGLQLSRLGYRTLVMSVDPAHSLADAFDLETDLFHGKTGDPYPIDGRLAIHEVNIQKEIKQHWREISSYVISVLRTTGISDVEAEELAILPGMEELSAMMYVNQFRREERYDVIVLDCPPTAESLRFVSMPTTLEWYMKHIFPFQRGLLKAVRPLANRVSPVELPSDNYFANVQALFGKLDGVGELLGALLGNVIGLPHQIFDEGLLRRGGDEPSREVPADAVGAVGALAGAQEAHEPPIFLS